MNNPLIKNVAIHILCWVIYVFIYALLWSDPGSSLLQNMARHITLLPFKILLVYSCILFLVPRYLNSGRYVRFILWLAVLMTVCTTLHILYLYFIIRPDTSIFNAGGTSLDWRYISKQSTFLNSPLFFALAIVMARHWYEQKAINSRISAEKMTAELQLLRNQLQPHFFFNTLNNLYSVAILKPGKAPEMILKLSELMRYIINQQDTVTLKDELDYIKNYAALEELRYSDTVSIEYGIHVPNPENIRVPALILAPFLENAFKHGADGSERCKISLSIKTEDGYLHYCISNTKSPHAGASPLDKRERVGLDNLRKRLRIVFREDFILETCDEKLFTALLKIPVVYGNG